MRRPKGQYAPMSKRTKYKRKNPARGNPPRVPVGEGIVDALLQLTTDVLIGGAVVVGGIVLQEVVKTMSQPAVPYPQPQFNGLGYDPRFQQVPPQTPPPNTGAGTSSGAGQWTQPPPKPPKARVYRDKPQEPDGGVITLRQNKDGVFVAPRTRKAD